MLDTSELDLESFSFASKMRKSPTGKMRHVTEAFRTVLWFHSIRLASRTTSPSQMDAWLAARLALSDDARIDRKKQWRSYKYGRHSPSEPLVAAIEPWLPGSRALFNHPVWQILRIDLKVQDQLAGLLVLLPPAIYSLVRGNATPDQSHLMQLDGWDASRLRRLQRQVSLDSLACLIALLRLLAEEGRGAQAYVFSRAVCRSLLVMGPWLSSHGIAQPLADYVERYLLPLGSDRGWQHIFGGGGFLRAAEELALAAEVAEWREDEPLDSNQQADLRLDMLEDRFTIAMSMLVRPVPIAGASPDPGSERLMMKIFDLQRRVRRRR
ncbi:hypothetical protein [Variovorax sp. Root434]|uniref:hypothetical protein n=1 Tax=Variovorax sp. Root434 TaxID=1736536 RepID=UPI0012F97BE9|nr:hypothetical protein [Variovorax sp. Root434]